MARKPTEKRPAKDRPANDRPAKDRPGKKKRAGMAEALKRSYELLRGDRPVEAEEILDRIIEVRPETAPAHNYLGMARANQGQFDEAVACYRRALDIDPGLADAHNNLGNVLRHLGESEESAACYRRVLELAPGNAAARVNLGKALAKMENWEEARATYQGVLDDDPDNAKVLRNMARLQEAEGDTEGAIATFRRALELEPDSPEGLNDLGHLLDTTGETDEALSCFRRVIKMKPDFIGAHLNLGNALRNKGDLDEAETVLRHVLEIDPDSPGCHNNLGIVLRDQQREKEAITCFQRAIELKPDNVEAYNNLGNGLRHLGRNDEALDAYQRCIDINPEFMEAYLNRAKIYTFHEGDPELERLKGYLEKDDLKENYHTHLLYTLGKAHDDCGLYDQAFSYFEKGNKVMADQEPYNGMKHRASMELMKRMFVRPLAAPKEGPAADERIPIFIVGMSRSGKTITESMLAPHPDVYDAGERKEWGNAIDVVRDRHGITDSFPKCLDHMDAEKIRQIGTVYMEMVSRLSPESRYVINTIPGNYSHVGLFFLAFPHLRVIYCHRNPLDNFLQVYFYRYKHGNAYSYGFDRLVSYYADYQNIMRHWFRLYGGRMLNMEYEKTVDDPMAAARRVYDYCGLDFDPEAVADLELSAHEIGHWRHYEPHLADVRDALVKIVQQEAEAAAKTAQAAERAKEAEQGPEAS